ncbi:hypothetical protein RIF23_18415 [Lipingzhangella sp. LS1_29]|uniref:Uncharacterized protein n=1 Tax=Lipingzhangella rawalii TaxID=2055835 RepID=A0ABU2HBA2_9ACTN|nr:hypothetical protein [Lipingzhangella rawalii]MDS1272267.1 hypothetical protein [Lipingzhangella rawalii]
MTLSRLGRAPAPAPRPQAGHRDDRLGIAGAAVVVAMGLWFLATASAQHPNRAFDRLRGRDPTGLLIGNWRFFAPEPAQHDFHLLYRVLLGDGAQTEWRAASWIEPRRWRQTLWFPEHRREKAVFDLVNELVAVGGNLVDNDVTHLPAYRLLRDHVHSVAAAEHAEDDPPAQGFQFLIARHSGHDTSEDPDYLLVSPFEPFPGHDQPTSDAPSREHIRNEKGHPQHDRPGAGVRAGL